MPNLKKEFSYDYEALENLSTWSYGRIQKDVSTDVLLPDNLASVAVWLAANGKPWLRAKMLAKLLPAIGRMAEMSPDALSLIFQQDAARRQVRAKKLGRRKAKT